MALKLNRDTIVLGLVALSILYVINFIKNIVKGVFFIGVFVVGYLIYRNYYPEQFKSNEFNENQENNDPCQIPYNPTRGYELQ